MYAQLSRPEPPIDGSAATGGNPHESKEALQSGIVDTPLVRAFNLLRKCSQDASRGYSIQSVFDATEMLSLTYQLEILLHQVRRSRSSQSTTFHCLSCSGQSIKITWMGGLSQD
jgi:hypothetical protein